MALGIRQALVGKLLFDSNTNELVNQAVNAKLNPLISIARHYAIVKDSLKGNSILVVAISSINLDSFKPPLPV